jgi:hypothetical protein
MNAIKMVTSLALVEDPAEHVEVIAQLIALKCRLTGISFTNWMPFSAFDALKRRRLFDCRLVHWPTPGPAPGFFIGVQQ